jgi:hypothetical protein
MNIKKYKSLFFIAAAFLVSCSEYVDTVEPGPAVSADNPAVRFAASNTTSFEFDPGTPGFTISVIRNETNADNALEVPVTVNTNTDDAFIVPGSIVFPAGEDTVDVVIGISPSAPAGVALSVAISLDEQFKNPYKAEYAAYYGTVSLVKWELYAEGTWTSAFFADSWPQELYKADGQNIYRFYGPYTEGYDIRFEWDGSSESITPLNGEAAVVGGAPVWVYETGYVHPDFGMVSFCIDPDPEYTYFDLENKLLNLNGAFTVSAGSFGWMDEVYSITEFK